MATLKVKMDKVSHDRFLFRCSGLWGEALLYSGLFFKVFYRTLNKRQTPSPQSVSQKVKGLSWECLGRFGVADFFNLRFLFLFPQHSVGGDGNISTTTTLASEYPLPQGCRAGLQSPCACLQRPLVAAASLAEDQQREAFGRGRCFPDVVALLCFLRVIKAGRRFSFSFEEL